MPRTTPRWRRYTIRAVLCLLLGAVTTVGVAWGARVTGLGTSGGTEWTVFAERAHGRYSLGVYRAATMTACNAFHYDGTGSETIVWNIAPQWAVDAAEQTREPEDFVRYAASPLGVAAQRHCEWARLPALPGTVESRAYGWPLRALSGSWHYPVDAPGYREGFVTLGGEKRLPSRAILPGFLLDTLFYAAPWWVVLVTPGAIRRWRRRRRGRCIHCGYDLAGLSADDGKPTCPECGA